FSELAPTDMLLQRLGRLWRHHRENRPLPAPLFCLLDEDATLEDLRAMDVEGIKTVLGAKSFVYKPSVLLRSLEQWARLDSLSLPSGIRRIMAATYTPTDCPPAWQELEAEKWGDDLAARTIANMGTNIWKSLLDDTILPCTRLAEHTDYTLVLCAEDTGATLTLRENGLVINLRGNEPTLATAKALHRNTVKVADWHFTQRPRDTRLAPFHIDGRILVQADGTAETPGLAPGKRIYWDDALGLAVRKETP
ncbi:MAG: hypothetical protein IJU37_02760, partial [Desulfovibrio sp.]|nr:hypothetical protein [Desulfovibrio sp.]